MIFVDTGAWFARYVQEDVDHTAAKEWFASVTDRLLTTDYVIDELFTLLKVRGYSQIAYKIGATLLNGSACSVEYVDASDVQQAWTVFTTFRHKEWSFTDCVSRVVMERLKISTACAFDDHFRQFGTVTVVP